MACNERAARFSGIRQRNGRLVAAWSLNLAETSACCYREIRRYCDGQEKDRIRKGHLRNRDDRFGPTGEAATRCCEGEARGTAPNCRQCFPARKERKTFTALTNSGDSSFKPIPRKNRIRSFSSPSRQILAISRSIERISARVRFRSGCFSRSIASRMSFSFGISASPSRAPGLHHEGCTKHISDYTDIRPVASPR